MNNGNVEGWSETGKEWVRHPGRGPGVVEDNSGDVSNREALDRYGVGEPGVPNGWIDWMLDGCGGQI